MKAVQLTAWGRRPVLTDVPVPVPAAGEVLLQVTAAGICHSDLHVMDAPEGRLPYELPFTLGHEVAGRVVELGAGVDAGWVGTDVVVHGIWGCGLCRSCLRGRENYCAELTGAVGGGLGRDGGLAEYMLVPTVRHLVPTGGLAPSLAAPLTDAGLTAFHAIHAHDDVLAGGGTALVIGVGGLGHLAVQLLRARAEEVVVAAVDTREDARSLAARLGAQITADDAVSAAAALRSSTGERSFDLVLDFVGADATLASATDVLARGGTFALVGSAGGRAEISKSGGLPQGWSFSAPFWGPRSDLEAVVELAAGGHVSAETQEFPLSRAIEVYELLRQGQITGRAVLVP
jgi:propanol-preferring alcohol dehydrogenase